MPVPKPASAALGIALAVSFAGPAPAANIANGKALFSRCAACHTADKGGPNGLGPNLYGVIGRKAGSKKDFSYSASMRNSGIVWTNQKLDAYITHPSDVVPGNRMAFAGLPDAKQRADLIAWLDTLK
ncbi:MAG TPA: cytochrome c family protein [Rhizomicrobium sp.]